MGGPYPSEQAAMQDKGRDFAAQMRFLCPAMPLPGVLRMSNPGIWCRVFRRYGGKDLRDAQASTDQNGQPERALYSLPAKAASGSTISLRPTLARVLAVVLDGKVHGSGEHQRSHSRYRRNQRWQHDRAAGQGSVDDPALGRAARRHQVSRRANVLGRRWAPIRSAPAFGPPSSACWLC